MIFSCVGLVRVAPVSADVAKREDADSLEAQGARPWTSIAGARCRPRRSSHVDIRFLACFCRFSNFVIRQAVFHHVILLAQVILIFLPESFEFMVLAVTFCSVVVCCSRLIVQVVPADVVVLYREQSRETSFCPRPATDNSARLPVALAALQPTFFASTSKKFALLASEG